MENSTKGGRPYMGSSPRQAKSRQAMEYRLTWKENNECRRCTIPSRLTCNIATCSKPGTKSTPEARWAKKEYTPWSDRFSVDIDMPSSLMTCNRTEISSTIFLGSWPVPSTSPTDRGDRGELGLTMVVRGRASVSWRRQRLPRCLCLVG